MQSLSLKIPLEDYLNKNTLNPAQRKVFNWLDEIDFKNSVVVCFSKC